jgi:hypothetical protein
MDETIEFPLGFCDNFLIEVRIEKKHIFLENAKKN